MPPGWLSSTLKRVIEEISRLCRIDNAATPILLCSAARSPAMEDILTIIIQFLLELLGEALLNLPFDWPSRRRGRLESDSPFRRSLPWLAGGCLLGLASLWVLPHSLIPLPALRIATLLLAPLLSGMLSYWLTVQRSRNNANLRPRNHFWQAFGFTAGLAAVRFACTA